MARKPDVQYIHFYADGTAARKAEVVKPANKTTLPAVKKQQTTVIHLDPLAMTGILVSVVMLVLMIVSCVQLSNLQEQTTAMYDYVNDLEEENACLRDTYEKGFDLDTIRQQALGLGMVPVDQVRHISVNVPVQESQQSGHTVLVDGIE